ncbi:MULTISPECIES: helix-turn-helix domain-containing protein [unclassified Kitasatospora]|uniref:helix-turn-helix domain-containing protein n=1 Tax=unclassified Kitasatospora TaxID=2633591 RepID=UPI0033C7CF0D
MGHGAPPLSPQDISVAGWVGASREAIVRTMRQLRDEGIVTTERKVVVIHDLEALRRLGVPRCSCGAVCRLLLSGGADSFPVAP